MKKVQNQHHERISNERYACIFRNLAKFDKQKQLPTGRCSVPLIRAALYRARFNMNKNRKKNSNRLLFLTATLVSNLSLSHLSSSLIILFNGLKQAGKYRESILNGLWSYQLLNIKSEQKFNQWLCNQSYCSICNFFIDNKSTKNKSNEISPIRYLLKSEISYDTSDNSNELLQCSLCHVCVHRDCYESVCLALNVQINDEYDPWLCQRCILQKQVNRCLLVFFS